MAADEDVARFIQSSFRSVWSLELLLLLKREPRPWSPDDLVESLRASDLIIHQALQSLVAGGLVAVDARGAATYMPASPAISALVDQSERLYARKPDAVRRMIVAATASSVTAFSDAFRLRKD